MTIPPSDAAAPNDGFAAEPRAPLDGFDAGEFQRRRQALQSACPEGLILIRGATEEEAHGVPYQQNSSFFYLTGVDSPGAFLLMLPEGVSARSGKRDLPEDTREILFLPPRNPATETWTGPQLGPGEETARSAGVQAAVETGALWGGLSAWIQRCPLLYTLTPYGEGARLSREFALMQRIAERAPTVQFRDLSLPLSRLRAVKSPAEIHRIEQAIAVTMEGHKAARNIIAAGRWEYEVEARLLEAFRSRGAGLAFPSIVGSGINGAILHYGENCCSIAAGDLVVVDIGARVGHYCGDITRAYPVDGVFTPRQREIYSLVAEAHREAVAGYEPGVDTLRTLDDKCKKRLKESPIRARDTKGAEATMDTFMPHGLGHFLGLDVHDTGDAEPPLEPGQVITIEPGIYIPSEKIGIRLEDDYLVTETGLRRLGPSLEREPEEVENFYRARS